MGQTGSCEAVLNKTALANATEFPHYLYWSFEEIQTSIWPIFFYILGVVYTFFAIALICDEFFVPALERICDRFKIPPNIAGATFMAAGGSAPELATSFVGTFSKSAVGFGTIVGSAVFNVLFVIGVCAFLSSKVLELSYWPLFRDSAVYCVSLAVLALFFGGITPDRITWYEALVLLLMYGGYIAIMTQNNRLRKCSDRTLLRCKRCCRSNAVAPATDDDDSSDHPPEKVNFSVGIHRVLIGKRLSKRAGWFAVTQVDGDAAKTFAQIDKNHDHVVSKDEFAAFLRKMGHAPTPEEIESVLEDFNGAHHDTVTEAEFVKWYIRSELRVHRDLVSKFLAWDHDEAALLTRGQLAQLLVQLGVSDEASAEALAKEAFDSCRAPLGPVSPHASHKEDVTLTEVVPVTPNAKHEAPCKDTPQKQPWVAGAASSSAALPRIAFADFKAWLERTPDWKKLTQAQEPDEDEDDALWIEWPTKQSIHSESVCKLVSARLMFLWTLPLVLIFVFTVPDTRRAPTKLCSRQITWKNWWLPSFALSIGWICFFSYLMVWWAEVIGKVSTLPSSFIGLTLLAAGTSIPDLASSVIVAKKGRGDMAVSSSIGSNIFDILIGLPLPWLTYSLYRGLTSLGACTNALGVPQPDMWCFSSPVVADTLLFSVLLLIAMIGGVIGLVACSGWRMTRAMGLSMLVLYVLFVVQDTLRNCEIVPAVAQYLQWLP